MAKFSILVRVHKTTGVQLQQLLGTMEMQTEQDWELILVTGKGQTQDQDLVDELVEGEPRLRAEVRPVGELIEISANHLAALLGTWTGFLGQADLLQPTALAAVEAALLANPESVIAFTDEECRDRHGNIFARFNKGAINPLRLRHQEYLRDLVAIQTAWLQEVGGFDLLASDWPRHDIYLKALENRGLGAFVNVNSRLYQRFWDYPQNDKDLRRRSHMVGYDLHAIKGSLERLQIPAQVRQRVGTCEIRYGFSRRPWVSLIVVDDGSTLMEETIRNMATHTLYRPLDIKVITPGDDLVAQLNQEMLKCDRDLICILQGLPLHPAWLGQMVDHAMLPGTGAVGARLTSPARMTQPGLLNYRFEGWGWNTRGRFNELSVPHQVSAVSPHALLIDPRLCVQQGGFKTNLPTLYAMDLCLRLDAAGYANLMVPDATAMVQEATPIDPGEITDFWALWPEWTCRFGLHLPRE